MALAAAGCTLLIALIRSRRALFGWVARCRPRFEGAHSILVLGIFMLRVSTGVCGSACFSCLRCQAQYPGRDKSITITSHLSLYSASGEGHPWLRQSWISEGETVIGIEA